MAENTAADVPAVFAEIGRRKPSGWRRLITFARTKPLGAIGGLVLLSMMAVAIVAPVISPYDPLMVDYDNKLVPPCTNFLLGTDKFGRDVLSRIIWGTRTSLYVGVLAVVLGKGIGGILGIMSAYLVGKFDLFLQRVMDSLIAFPALILALAMVSALGPSKNNVVIAIALVFVASGCRVVRSAALSVKENQYVEAARAIGCSMWRIMLLHIAPQCVAPFIIVVSVALGSAILMEASLSFLGVGTPPPEPSWGRMLSGEGRSLVETAPWLAVFPGIAISLAVYGINILGDALRDVLDPRLRGR